MAAVCVRRAASELRVKLLDEIVRGAAKREPSDEDGVRGSEDADARRALAAPIFDAYVDLTFAFEAVALKTGAQVVGVCARCAAVLTSNRKCARCKVANYCSRDCQARHWDTHKATCRKADQPPRPPAPPGGAPIVQAVGRAANLEGAGAAAMNDLETQMQGLAQILREGGAGAADMRRAVADVPQAG